MGFPIARMAGRAAFIGAMIAGGLLAAGIAQAQAQTIGEEATARASSASFAAAPSPADNGQPTPADRQAELIAASGGPAPAQHLIMAAPERPAVEQRADDVEEAAPDPADALNAAEATGGKGTTPAPAPNAPPTV